MFTHTDTDFQMIVALVLVMYGDGTTNMLGERIYLKCVDRDEIFEEVAQSGVDMVDRVKQNRRVVHF